MDPSRLTSLLSALKRCGIDLAPDARVEDFAASLPEDADVLDVLCILGDEYGNAGRRWSKDIWHCDPERIGGDGDYVDVAERMRDIARGDLPLEAIEDRVDEDECWLTFALDGKRHHWNLDFNEDWMDPAVLERLARLMAARDTGRRFTYCDLGGQDFLVGCATPAQLQRLNELTGLSFQWLALKKGPGPFSNRQPGVGPSQAPILGTGQPDRLERNIKFGCGALLGFVLGFLFSVRFLPGDLKLNGYAMVAFALVVAVLFGRAAMRY